MIGEAFQGGFRLSLGSDDISGDLCNMESQQPTQNQFDAYHAFIVEGTPQTQVAERFGVYRTTITNWCNKVAEWNRDENRERVGALRTRVTDRYEYIYRQAVQGFKKSQENEIVTTTADNGDKVTETVRETPQCGNPAFLAIATKVLEGVTKLWHVDMAANERRGDVRMAGKSHLEQVEAQLARLTDTRQQIVKSLERA